MPRRVRASVLDALLWVLAGISVVAIVALSLQPEPPRLPGVDVGDKAQHAAAYFSASGLLLLAAVWRPVRGWGSFPHGAVTVAVAMFALGVTLELVQVTIPERSAEVSDVAANGAAIALAFGGWTLARRAFAITHHP